MLYAIDLECNIGVDLQCIISGDLKSRMCCAVIPAMSKVHHNTGYISYGCKKL